MILPAYINFLSSCFSPSGLTSFLRLHTAIVRQLSKGIYFLIKPYTWVEDLHILLIQTYA